MESSGFDLEVHGAACGCGEGVALPRCAGEVIDANEGQDEGEVRCVEREREALVRFKKGVIDESGILSSWVSEDSKKDCCKWKGVVCGNTNTNTYTNTNTTYAHVIALLLGYEYNDYPYTKPLGGNISDALLELHHLTNLDLSMNDFDYQFPRFMGSMKQLEHLNLRACYLHGTLPPQLGNLTNLRTLNLWGPLRSENLDWLSHLSLLNRLDLSLIDLSHTSWLQQILKLRSLQELSLAYSNIGATIPAGVPSANSSSVSLSILDLSCNALVSSNLDWLFNTSTRLSILNMRRNKLDGQIPHVFGRLVLLEDLDLSGNMLEGGISESLRNLSHLQALDLSSNDFSGDLEDFYLGIYLLK
ncbi:receptor-like protein EIX1 [Salvia splendens]|uniref:receptor-like protein EIX1 n=1 Tax=Salvia splendens TaxID=180675 RepID=UPI001C280388|nr:receptor-like protein EIX1 [Salvia splendens]